MSLTAVFQKVPEGYIGFVEELPGANTQGKTVNERLLLALPHRQFVFTFPKLLRPYFRHNRRLSAPVGA